MLECICSAGWIAFQQMQHLYWIILTLALACFSCDMHVFAVTRQDSTSPASVNTHFAKCRVFLTRAGATQTTSALACFPPLPKVTAKLLQGLNGFSEQKKLSNRATRSSICQKIPNPIAATPSLLGRVAFRKRHGTNWLSSVDRIVPQSEPL